MVEAIDTKEVFDWDPSVPNQMVRMRANPGRQGVTTGRTKLVGNFLLVEINFGPNDKSYKRYHHLELFNQDEDFLDLFRARKFGGVDDLRRILTYEKIKGDLTNIYYSMESSNTTFYPHQFKPVLKFIESPVGRLLIADEVGLGKTIEAIYIWKELQARHDMRRLLIICPAMLREKWKNDLLTRFNINAEIVSARKLLNNLNGFATRRQPNSFVSIASLESLRTPANYEDDTETDVRAEIARLLDSNSPPSENSLLDLVIIDEAHYLRNVSTASNRLGRLLRESAHHLILLTATPVHIDNENLYQLLRLIDPDEFYELRLFSELLAANAPIIRSQRALWESLPDLETALTGINQALRNEYFFNDDVLIHLHERFRQKFLNPADQVECARLLESRSLLSQYMTRTRKREANIPMAERQAQTLEVEFCEIERKVYDQISRKIRELSIDRNVIYNFTLIMRQRQMASSLAATLKNWNESKYLDELLWEDTGRLRSQSVLFDSRFDQTDFFDIDDIELLQENDSKYEKLREFLLLELGKDPKEKFVIFAYFRATIEYLAQRLKSDGVKVSVIMGGMGETIRSSLDEFRRTNGSSVLLSSEVGTEGIDLQFCRYIVNYDLPWNPMRVEQRIGRIDRLGQQSEKIFIVNLFVSDTIEDRILNRLYERLGIFRESIGDLEEILGERTQNLMLELLDPNLSEEKREERAMQAELALINQRNEQRKLEDEAINLIGIGTFILDNIQLSREKGRWISSKELIAFVDDFFKLKYPGTIMSRKDDVDDTIHISLSTDAQVSLSTFIRNTKPAIATNLGRSSKGVFCSFDTRAEFSRRYSKELIETNHPLIQWICSEYKSDNLKLHPISTIGLSKEKVDFPKGDYVYLIEKWSLVGTRSEKRLAFKATRVGHEDELDELESEKLVTQASQSGSNFSNASNLIGNMEEVISGFRTCEEALQDEFEKRLVSFEAENTLRCRQQKTSARNYSNRRLAELKERIERFRNEGKIRPIRPTEGMIHSVELQLQTKLQSIENRKDIDPTCGSVGVGLIRIE